MPNYTKYTLPEIDNLDAGNIKCYLFVDSRVPALTIPTESRVISLNPTREAVDLKAGEVDLDNRTIEMFEDYSIYTQGFWWKLIEEYPLYDVQFLFILNEDGVDTFRFRGSLFRNEIHWGEGYISDSGDYERRVSIQLVSPLIALKGISINDLINNILTNHDTDATPPYNYLVEGTDDVLEDSVKCLTIANVFNAMLELAFGADGESYQLAVRGCDIKLFNAHTSAYYGPFDGYIRAMRYDTAWYASDFFAQSVPYLDEMSWNSRFENCFQLMCAICFSLGVVPRYYFGDSNGIYQGSSSDKHSIEILTRGDRTSTKITNTGIYQSEAISNSPVKVLNILIKNIATIDSQQYLAVNGLLHSGTFPQNVTFDIEATAEFSTDTTTAGQGIFYKFVDGGAVTHFGFPTKQEYWDHRPAVNDWVEITPTAFVNAFLGTLCTYLYYRFSSGRKQVSRKYYPMKFSDGSVVTHQVLKVLARHDIYGVTFYASDVTKDDRENSATVKWEQE